MADAWVAYSFQRGGIPLAAALPAAICAPIPPAWVKIWLEDHPPLGERIRFALYGQPDQWP